MKPKRWDRWRAIALSVLLLVSCAAAAGCGALVVGAAAGAGAVAYIRGELKATEEAPIDQVFAATKAAIAELQFTTLSAEADAYDGKVRAETAAGKDVAIALKRESDTTTTIRIRVNKLIGDEELSRLIHDKIRAHLETS